MSRALTLVESNNPEHQNLSREIVSACIPLAGNSIRIAISGSPGVGKSTIIEALGLHAISQGCKPAILAIDPSSDITKGSILGDKTRMENLAKNEIAFIRPSPTSGTLGGVTNTTIESIILCEAAGYDTIFIETVGVGQSETFAQKLSDIFILLVAPGGGDELQGIKRGIVELADIIVVNKAEEDRKALSEATIKAYKNAIHLATAKESGWIVNVISCSALNHKGIDDLWKLILAYRTQLNKTEHLKIKRKTQDIFWATSSIQQKFSSLLRSDEKLNELQNEILSQIESGKLSPDKAAQTFLSKLVIKTRS